MSGTPVAGSSGVNGSFTQGSPSLPAPGPITSIDPSVISNAAAPFLSSDAQDIPVPQNTLFRAASESSDSNGSVIRQLQGSAPRASTSRALTQDGGSASKKRTRFGSEEDDSELSSVSSDSDDEALATGPAYTIERSSDPMGPHLLRCTRSDALEKNWPKVGPFQDSKGAACTWTRFKADDRLGGRWLAALGTQLAIRLKLQSGASATRDRTCNELMVGS